MNEVHKYVGFAIVAGFTVLWIVGLGARMMKREDAGRFFWVLVSVMQVVAVLQALLGVVLLLTGPPASDVLHYVYGIVPILAFIGAHAYARNMTITERPFRYVPFAFVGFISMGLALRAIMTGLGQ